LKKLKREKATSTKGHYVTNAILLPAVLEAKKLGKVTDELARLLLLIAERYSRKSWFSGYSYREDMVSVAVTNLCNNALKFNPDMSKNPFAYFTTAIHRSFQNYKSEEKKHRNIRDALLLDAGANPSFNFLEQEHHENKVYDDGAEVAEPVIIPEIAVADEIAAPAAGTGKRRPGRAGQGKIPGRPTVRAESRASGEVTVWKPGTFTVDNGNITFIEPALQRAKRGAAGELVITAGRARRVTKKPPNRVAAAKKLK